jgi:hypothetical protein
LLFAPQACHGDAGGMATKPGATEYEMEPLMSGVVDLGVLATEFLILGLDPYPRKTGAVFQPLQERGIDETPFSALGALKKAQDAD